MDTEDFSVDELQFKLGEGGSEEVSHDLGTRELGYPGRRVGLSSQKYSHFLLPPVSANGVCASGDV